MEIEMVNDGPERVEAAEGRGAQSVETLPQNLRFQAI